MRSATVVAISIGVGLVALAVVRLAASLSQVQTLATSLSVTQDSARPRERAATRLEAASAVAAVPEGADEALAGGDAAAASRSDEQIQRWLAADPELRRAADELLRDPDADVRRDAEQLLRELGVTGSPSDTER